MPFVGLSEDKENSSRIQTSAKAHQKRPALGNASNRAPNSNKTELLEQNLAGLTINVTPRSKSRKARLQMSAPVPFSESSLKSVRSNCGHACNHLFPQLHARLLADRGARWPSAHRGWPVHLR